MENKIQLRGPDTEPFQWYHLAGCDWEGLRATQSNFNHYFRRWLKKPKNKSRAKRFVDICWKISRDYNEMTAQVALAHLDDFLGCWKFVLVNLDTIPVLLPKIFNLKQN